MRGSLVRDTTSGQVEGLETEQTWAWRGIPFAASTAGPNRLQPPQPATPWHGTVRQCKTFGPSPPQVKAGGAIGEWLRPVSEDCLSINVIVPKGTTAHDTLPVLVWIYGGGFMEGSNSEAYYDGTNLARQGKLVLVSMNYRVSALGCQSFTRFNTSKHQFVPNCGLKDQVAALQWVQKNIRNFGGDPKAITLMGESAGATSVISHFCIPESKDLFQRAFVMSVAANATCTQTQQDYYAAQILQRLGVDPNTTEAAAEALMTRPWKDIIAASTHVSLKMQPDELPGCFAAGPVIEPGFLDASLLDTFTQGKQHKKPLVLVSQDREGSLFNYLMKIMPITEVRAQKMFELTSIDQTQIERLREAYKLDKNPKKGFVDLGGDSTFWHSSVLLAEAHSRHGAPVWFHLNRYAPPLLHLLGIGCTHALGDIWLYFGNLNRGVGRVQTLGQWWGYRRAQAVSARFQGHLFNFIRQDQPVEDAAAWPTYNEKRRATLVTRREGEADDVVDDFRRERREAWGQWSGYTRAKL